MNTGGKGIHISTITKKTKGKEKLNGNLLNGEENLCLDRDSNPGPIWLKASALSHPSYPDLWAVVVVPSRPRQLVWAGMGAPVWNI